ncbi:MAG: SDR family oxidoreductase [Flavobacteriales bacterium]|nr:SDR family oxidoreductase [Flavobacteriales bacterium]MBP9078762.1 SDR family oxidoreductase [Flavobacteriales bacterium]
MDIRLDGKHALIGGGTQGIGHATAMAMADLGAHITLLARDEAKLEQAVATLDARHGRHHGYLVADMADTGALDAAINGHLAANGPWDILVNNTGGPPPGLAHEAPIDAYEQAFRLHLLAFQTLVRAVVPGMKAQRNGRIINVISTSVKSPLPNLGVSNTIRGAVAQWGKTLATELGPFNITVNNVLPGATATGRLQAIIANKAKKAGGTEEEAAGEMVAEIPLRRFAEPSEVACAICFLAGPSGAYINGINLPVDGGRTSCL